MKDKSSQGIRPRVYVFAIAAAVILAAVLWPSRTPRAPVEPTPETPAQPAPLPDPNLRAHWPTAVPSAQAQPSQIEEHWGIQVSSISLTNADTSVDLRYTIVDPDKTTLLTGVEAEVFLIDNATGKKIPMFTAPAENTAPAGVPRRTFRRMMRQAGSFPPAPSRMIAGGTYSLQIPNWGRTLRSGAKVTLVVGNYRVDDLTVE